MTLVQAQERTYSGTVKSADDGQVIIGANVAVVGTTQGTSTGVDGTYSIKARVGSQLTFSYLGMQSQTVTVGNSSVINVTLQSDATSLEDVVVVAFGTAKKKDLTGSMSSIDSKIISQQANSTLSKALEGSIPGLQVASISGQPGADATIRIRGLGTANANNAGALIVIDGVPSSNPNVLATLNPRDIESMVVSKDAASNSLYGSRGANGVVLVTTKKGSQGKARVTFDAKFGVNAQGVPNYDRVTDPGQYYEYAWQNIYNSVRYKDVDRIDENGNGWKGDQMTMNDADARQFASHYLFKYNGQNLANNDWMKNASNDLGNYMLYDVPGATYENGYVTNGKYLIDPATGKLNPTAKLLYQDDWEDEFNKPRFRQEYNISVSGATEKTDYFISAGYLDDPSYITGSEFSRYNARVNVNTQINSWLKAGLNMSYARRYLRQPAVRWGGYNPGTVSQNIFFWMLGMTPLKPLWARDLNGNYIIDEKTGERVMDLGSGQTESPFGPTSRVLSGNTPLVLAYQDKWETTTDDITSRGYVEAKFLKDFKFTANVALDNTYQFENRYNNLEYGEAQSYPGQIRKSYTNYLTLNTQQLLNWNHSFGKHNLDMLLGHEYYWYGTNSLSGDKQMMAVNGMDEFNNAVKINSVGGERNKQAVEGYFARFNYNFDNKYYVSASVRGDGSSKFKEDRWGAFWSVGGAWRISGENWMQDVTWINDLKLRANYGTMGNQNAVTNYIGYNLWNLGNAGDIKTPSMSISQRQIGNADLSWETVKTFDLGLDFRLWDRVYGSIEYYIRDTHDMIWARPVAYSTGQTSLNENSASMRNTGIEFEIGVDIIRTPDILWSVNVNGAHYKNKLTSLPEGVGTEALGGNYAAGYFLRGVGLPYYNYYISKYAGVDPNTGLGMVYHTVTAETQSRFPGSQVGDIVKTTDGALATKYEAGDATPSLTGGFGTNFRYKNFDVSAQFAFALGGRFLNRDFVYGGLSSQGFARQPAKVWLDAWTPTNRGSNLPMRMVGGTNYGIENSQGWTDLGLFKCNYLSVKNIMVGYNLPQKLMDRWGMGGIRVYAALDNMWFISSQKGVDPRQSLDDASGVGPYSYPQMRTASLGINVTF